MTRRTKGEQKAYLDGYEMCAECIEEYLTNEGKRILDCLLVAVRNAVGIEDIEPQESEDAISRQAVFGQINCWIGSGEYRYTNATDYLIERVKHIPSVNPQPKTGHWMKVVDEDDGLGNMIWHHECSICGNNDSDWGEYKYCPNCGAKMEESEEEQ